MPAPLFLREADALPRDEAPLPAQADVVIAGGGIAGISTALALARAGVSAVVLEAEVVAARASGRNDGQMLLGLGEHYNRIVGQLGRERARLLWDYILRNNQAMKDEIAAAGNACGLESRGGLRLSCSEHEQRELEEASALMREDGIPHELLPAEAIGRVLPAARGFHGVLRLPGEAIVQPAAMVRGFALRAREAGARIVEGARVVAIERDGDDASRVVLADGRAIRCAMVVHCTSTLARELDASGFLKAQVFPFRGQIHATAVLPDAIAAQFPPCAMSTHFCYEYFRVHEKRFVVGGMRWSVPGEQLGILDDQNHDDRVSVNLRAFVDRHFPALAAIPFVEAWSGIMAGTHDALPLLGALPGRPGVMALLGFNGYGLSFAFEAGRSLAQIVVDGKASHPAVALFAPRRFA
ncbi:MAG: FAD-binding oxidoreductase [Planctomycetes bacterium]|nr:FAD-binding oxidoreductase [Planctomycetota bacterium]